MLQAKDDSDTSTDTMQRSTHLSSAPDFIALSQDKHFTTQQTLSDTPPCSLEVDTATPPARKRRKTLQEFFEEKKKGKLLNISKSTLRLSSHNTELHTEPHTLKEEVAVLFYVVFMLRHRQKANQWSVEK